jgi:hypothetical protein
MKNVSNESLVKGLKLNKVSNKNIELFLQLKEVGEKLDFEIDNTDGMDGEFFVTFSIKEEFNS